MVVLVVSVQPVSMFMVYHNAKNLKEETQDVLSVPSEKAKNRRFENPMAGED